MGKCLRCAVMRRKPQLTKAQLQFLEQELRGQLEAGAQPRMFKTIHAKVIRMMGWHFQASGGAKP